MIDLSCVVFDREKYIPITRRTLIRRIIEERDLLTPLEQRKFDEFAVALDSAIVQEYHGVLNDLKVGESVRDIKRTNLDRIPDVS